MNANGPSIPRIGRVLAVGLALASAVSMPRAAESTAAARAVRAVIDAEKTLLEEDLIRQGRLAQERKLTLSRLDELYTALDAAIARRDAPTIETLAFQLQETERQRSDQLDMERLVIERVRDRLRGIAVLEEHVAKLDVAVERAEGPLHGRWTVSLLPSAQHGVFDLEQNGTLVSGTYELEGGWTGSLTGTLVDRKVHLVRIDSKLGRSMEFEGYLSVDGTQIRGSWLGYELAGDSTPSGQWIAVRRGVSP